MPLTIGSLISIGARITLGAPSYFLNYLVVAGGAGGGGAYGYGVGGGGGAGGGAGGLLTDILLVKDRKSTRLNSSH